MEDLVMAYIQARSPTCILCMGNKAAYALERTRDISSAPFWPDVSVVLACHPSRSLHYASEDVQMRSLLLDKTKTACAIVAPDAQAEHALSPTAAGCEFELINFMELLLCCCFAFKLRLPPKSLTRGTCCFELQSWHRDWLNHVLQETDDLSRTCARLIPVFYALNSAIRRSSWVSPAYSLNRPSAIRILTEYFTTIEAACYQIATYQLHCPMPAEPPDSDLIDEDGMGGFVRHVCRITSRNLRMWQDMEKQIPRRSTWVGFAAE